ncbi:MAG: diguanylate cyclase [Desulfuromonadales bacterium]|nr:diguanylate cyclase [Desulfuromonadales bacterium]NIR34031.1 diguanylate cyclase [Desulfuromonadales bacterium]NIS44082.1 diguanylate cyclase [Desulfuromonadales bacterium]
MLEPREQRFSFSLRNLSLPAKVLIPFFLILLLLGTAATVGAILLLKESKFKTIDERLQAFHVVIRKEMRTHQDLLKIVADLVSDSKGKFIPANGESAPTLYRYASAEQAVNFKIRYVPIDKFAAENNPATQMALTDAIAGDKPVNTVLHTRAESPALAIVGPVGPPGKPQGAVIIHSSIDDRFLSHLPVPDNCSMFLLNKSGRLLSSTTHDFSLRELTGDELLEISRGSRIFETISPPFGHRVLYDAIPLGQHDLILAIAYPMDDLRSLVGVMTTRSFLTIVAALLLGGFIYALIIRSIMAPIKELLVATDAVSSGELGHRLSFTGKDEFSRLAHSFNFMLNQLEKLYEERLEHQRKLDVTTEELRHKKDIESKNEQIARANSELEATVRELSALFQCNQAMISTLDLNLLFDRILSVLQNVLVCDDLALLLHNEEEGNLTVRKVLGLDPEKMDNLQFHFDEGITGEAARNKRTVYVEDLSADERSLGYKGRAQTDGSLMSAPMVIRGRLIGVLNLHKNAVGAFSHSEIKLAQAIANQAAIAIENAHLYETTRSLSMTDELTGLANRRHFQEILEREKRQAERYKGKFSIVMLDIDHFKNYNDTHGHLTGDAALKEVAGLLLENTRGVDLVARFGGEEFVILLSQTDCAGGVRVAEKIRSAVHEMQFPGEAASQPGRSMTVSLGVTTYPDHGLHLEELLNLADTALYRAKKSGRNRVAMISSAED